VGLYTRVKISPGINPSISYNPRRVFLMIVNESDYTIYISEDPQNVRERGIPIYPYEIIVYDKSDGDRCENAFYIYSDYETYIRIYEGVV
jgi:hypothetical protein